MGSEPGSERIRLTEAESRARRRRSIAIGISLFVLVVLFYVMTFFRMGVGSHG